MIKAACVFAALVVACDWQLARWFRELEQAFQIREGW